MGNKKPRTSNRPSAVSSGPNREPRTAKREVTCQNLAEADLSALRREIAIHTGQGQILITILRSLHAMVEVLVAAKLRGRVPLLGLSELTEGRTNRQVSERLVGISQAMERMKPNTDGDHSLEGWVRGPTNLPQPNNGPKTGDCKPTPDGPSGRYILLDCRTGALALGAKSAVHLTNKGAQFASAAFRTRGSDYRWLLARRFLVYGEPEWAKTFDDRSAADSYADAIERGGLAATMIVRDLLLTAPGLIAPVPAHD